MKLNRQIIIDAIQKIYAEKGMEALSGSRIFTALLKDSLGIDSREGRALIHMAAGTQIRELLLAGLQEPAEIADVQRRILLELENELGMSRENAGFFLQLFSDSFGWTLQEGMPEASTKQAETPPVLEAGIPKMPKKESVLRFGGMDWIVLTVLENSVLLLSKEVTDIGIPYHTVFMDISWKACSLRTWLNTVFLERFTKEEQAGILLCGQKNRKNPWYGTGSEYETEDKVFLLSIEEAVEYFGDSGQLAERPATQWLGKMVQKGRTCAIDDAYNSKRQTRYKNKETWWWLRSSGSRDCNAAYVNTEGVIFLNGDSVFDTGGTSRAAVRPGVRPALWHAAGTTRV